MQSILNFDWAVFQFIEKHIWNNFLDKVFPVITTLGDTGLIWICIAVFLLFIKKYRRVGVVMAVALILDYVAVDIALKNLFGRPRPFDFDWQGLGAFVYPNLIDRPGSFAFPSGHTAVSFAGAVAMISSGKKWMYIPALVLAALIGFSRIYVHVHYCTDVLAGVVVGALCGAAAIFIVRRLEPHVVKKFRN